MILLLAGTAEARSLASMLAERGHPAQASLAGATRDPAPLALPTRIGGFGGAHGFRAYLDAHQIAAVIDATHPFAHRISDRTAAICAERGTPYLHLRRPEWQPTERDRWHPVTSPADLPALIPSGTRLFLATGRQSLAEMEPLKAGRTLFLRQIDEPDSTPDGVTILLGRPPFSLQAEEALLNDLAIDWLVVKNAGGAGGAAKLHAARALGLPVAMLARPAAPDAPIAETIQDALAWLENLS